MMTDFATLYESAKQAFDSIFGWRKSSKIELAAHLRDIAQKLRDIKQKIDDNKIPKEESYYVMALSNHVRGFLSEPPVWKYPDEILDILEKFKEVSQRLMMADVFIDISKGKENYRHFTKKQIEDAIMNSGIRDLHATSEPVYGFADSKHYLSFLPDVASNIAGDALALAGELEAYANVLARKVDSH